MLRGVATLFELLELSELELLPLGVVAPPWLLELVEIELELLLGILLLELVPLLELYVSLVPPSLLQPTMAMAAPRIRIIFFISLLPLVVRSSPCPPTESVCPLS